MQYEITLPADYDMGIIRTRVAAKGHLLDAFPGLGFKAYLIRERGVHGSPVNAYAPFYAWSTPQGMNAFLWGDGFRGVIRDFGRPVVQHWTGLGSQAGPARSAAVGAASLRRRPIAAAEDPADVIAGSVAEGAELAAEPGVHTTVLAVDPRHWELVRCTLWTGTAAPPDAGDAYQVLHLSTPGLDALGTGRQW